MSNSKVKEAEPKISKKGSLGGLETEETKQSTDVEGTEEKDNDNEKGDGDGGLEEDDLNEKFSGSAEDILEQEATEVRKSDPSRNIQARLAAGDAGKVGKGLNKKKDLAKYKIRPDLDDKFRPGVVQVLIEKILREHLDGQRYDAVEMPIAVKIMTEEIQEKVKAQKYKRYKIVTYLALGERKGEGVSSATRCIWDAESDCLASYTFLNETLFCCATVYGIYYY